MRYTIEGEPLPVVICDLAAGDTMITESIADKIVAAGIEKVKVRSVLGCRSKHGVCQKCYGMSLARHNKVEIGETIGIVAAQSIGEPGTQLTMNTKHAGGAIGSDITQGRPRVEELFEARKPKGLAVMTEIAGKVKVKESKKKKEVIVTSDNPRSEEPQRIITDILTGFKSLDGITVEADRGKAIALLKEIASEDDVVVIAGKGHEDYQILADKTIHFDDREEAKKVFGV